MKPGDVPSDPPGASRFAILRVGRNLLVSLQVELRDTVADAFQETVLEAIQRTDAQGLLIDISAVDLMDSYVARVLADTGRMARLMGTETILVGMRAEVAATLIRMGYTMPEVRTALNLEESLVEVGRGRLEQQRPGGTR